MGEATVAAFEVRLAQGADDLRAAQQLRYEVFVSELGGEGETVDTANRLETDRFDTFCDHLLLIDRMQNRIAGVYRLLRAERAQEAGGFYSASEYDLSPLLGSGKRLLELGRSCLHPDYRGGAGLHQLWGGLARYAIEHRIDMMFGVASFHGTDINDLAAPLSLLHHRHLAPEKLRVRAKPDGRQDMNLVPEERLDRRAAMLGVPGLIKAYLRLGGVVGEGAFIDRAFNTTDVCLMLDTAQLSERQRRHYGGRPN